MGTPFFFIVNIKTPLAAATAKTVLEFLKKNKSSMAQESGLDFFNKETRSELILTRRSEKF